MKKIFLLFTFLTTLLLSAEYGVLEKIKDGDTMVFRAEGRLITCRLEGIDTPEKFATAKLDKDASKAGVGCEALKQAGEASTDFAKRTLKVGKNYKLEVDKNDKYGRALCLVYDGQSLFNKDIVAEGYAVVYQVGKYIKDDSLKRELLTAEREAKEKNRGLWNG
ncbi:MAG: thermonuclease family protein, partial [Campylobacterales bacterium]|nr:thermonuclease family protein [Campylobacterales bacterium]